MLKLRTGPLHFIASLWLIAALGGCGDPELANDAPDPAAPASEEFPEAIEEPEFGEVFDYEFTREEWETLLVEEEMAPIDLLPIAAFRGVELMWSGEASVLEYQVARIEGEWGEWVEYLPDSSYAGMYGGVINLEEPAVAFRFRTSDPVDYIRFEFFEEAIVFDHDHDHEHDDDTYAHDDDEYMKDHDLDGHYTGEDFDTRGSELLIGEGDDGEFRTRKQAVVTSCTKKTMAGYTRGVRRNVTVIGIDGKLVELNTGSAFEKMRVDAAKSGVRIQVVSGFRTMEQQQYLYNCYLTKRCNNGNLAARPGYSNHQNGLALDLNTSASGVYNWLSRNASKYGFKRTVPSEPWHWEYLAGKTVSPQICSPPSKPKKPAPPPPPPPPRYDVALSAKIVGLKNFYNAGSSQKVADALVGDRFQAEIRMTNRSSVRIGPVRMGYWFEHPHLQAVSYRIDTDSPQHNQKTWRVNSANSEPKNPAKNRLGQTGTLHMHSFAPGETKRVIIDLVATEYSVGRADHPDVRVWLRHVPNAYGDQTSYSGKPSTNKIGRIVRAYAQLDVLSTDEWQFNSKKHAADLEGWRACHSGHHDRLIHNTNQGLLAMHVTGDNACIQSPTWTNIDADRYDQLVLGVRSHGGDHIKTLAWTPDSCSSVRRVGGSNRYATSANASRRLFPNGAQNAVLVLGDRPTSDAFVAGPLAAKLGGPVLLTGHNTLPQSIATELKRLNTRKVTIVGGPYAVSQDVERAVRALGMQTERVYGELRADTGAAVANRVGAPNREAVIVSSHNDHVIDGLLAASLASGLGAPVLLVDRTSVPAVTRNALRSLNITSTIVVGGTTAVSDATLRQLPGAKRVAGNDRYQTARAVARYARQRGLSDGHVYIARADEAIAAFSVAHTGDSILLSGATTLNSVTRSHLISRGGKYAVFKPATLVGGPAALSENVESNACLAVEGVDNYSVSFEARGNSTYQTLVLPLGDHPNWRGKVRDLRLFLLSNRRPAAGDTGWYDVQRVFMQSSSTRKTSSARTSYVTTAPAELSF